MDHLPQYPHDYITRTRKHVNLDEEMRLFSSNKERDMYDNMADLYSNIVLTEYLEKAFVSDAIKPEEYTPQCSSLIAKYKTTMSFLSDHVPNVSQFMKDYGLTCKAAANRFRIGVPATYEHAIHDGKHNAAAYGKSIMDVAESSITLLDALKLGQDEVDSLFPYVKRLMETLSKVKGLPPDFEGVSKVRHWLITLNQMSASDRLTEEQVRQMQFDINNSHEDLYRALSGEHTHDESSTQD